MNKTPSLTLACSIFLGLCGFCLPSSGAGPTNNYSITDLGTLGGTESFAYAINDPGWVVGQSRLAGDTETHSFLYIKGRMADLSPLNSGNILTVGPTSINNSGQIASGVIAQGIYYPALLDSKTGRITVLGSFGGVFFGDFNGVALSVNNLGQAVGYSYLDALNRHAFLYSNGVMTDIGSFGGFSLARGINDGGTIVGEASELVNGYSHAFIYSNGLMVEINPFGGPNNESSALAINNRGQVVGYALNTRYFFHGFVYWHGAITDIGTLEGGLNSYAFAINERGQIVGIADVPISSICVDPVTRAYFPCTEYVQAAFLYDGGEMKNLNSLIPSNSGWDIQWAFGINSRGQIVGYGVYDDHFHAFVLTP